MTRRVARRLRALAVMTLLVCGGIVLAAPPAQAHGVGGVAPRNYETKLLRVTPHVAQNTRGRTSAIDRRTSRHASYAQSQRARKRIEEAFGWIKTCAGQARTRVRGLKRVRWSFTLAATAYNLVRLPKLLAGSG